MGGTKRHHGNGLFGQLGPIPPRPRPKHMLSARLGRSAASSSGNVDFLKLLAVGVPPVRRHIQSRVAIRRMPVGRPWCMFGHLRRPSIRHDRNRHGRRCESLPTVTGIPKRHRRPSGGGAKRRPEMLTAGKMGAGGRLVPDLLAFTVIRQPWKRNRPSLGAPAASSVVIMRMERGEDGH
jgi:hypothetical protein